MNIFKKIFGNSHNDIGEATKMPNTRAEKFPPRLLLQPAGGKMAGSGAGQQKKQ